MSLRGYLTAIEERPAMVTLASTAALGATALVVEDAFNLPDAGTLIAPTVTLTYTAVDVETNTITLSAPTVAAYDPGESFLLGSGAVNRIGYVRLGADDDEPMAVNVPWGLMDLFTTGIQDPPPWVLVDEVGQGEWILVDAEQDATLVPTHRNYVAPGDPFPTDGLPPTSSPAAIVQNALGALVVSWTPIANVDAVSYEVHLSTTAGFTPTAGSAATLVGEIDGSMLWIRRDVAGEPLAYDVVYYVRIIATDVDGAASPGTVGSGTPQQVDSPDIAVDAVLANHILAGEVTADKLAAVLVLASVLKTAESGQRVEVSTAGIQLFDPSGNVIVSIPTTGDPFFRAVIEAIGIDIINSFTLRGAGVMETGSTMTLKSAQSDPATSPSLATVWETLALSNLENPNAGEGMDYDPTGGSAGSTPSFWVTDTAQAREFNASTGVLLAGRVITVPTTDRVKGVTRLGSYVFILTWQPATNRFYIRRYSQSSLAAASEVDITSNMPVSLIFRPGLGNDGTNLVVTGPAADTGGSGFTRVRLRAYNPTSLTFVSNTDLDSGYFVSGYSSCAFYGYEKVTEGGTPYHFIPLHSGGKVDGVHVFKVSDGLNQSTMFFPGSAGLPRGIAHDATQFWTQGSPQMMTKHTSWVWTTESPVYWCAYTWVDDNATASAGARPLGAGDFETRKSPTASITMARRARLRITVPTFPSGVTHCGVYMDRGSGEPTLDYITDSTLKTNDFVGFTAGGSAPPGSNTFTGGGSGARFQSQDGSPLLRANGYPRVKVKNGGGDTLTNSTETTLSLVTLEGVDTDTFWDGSSPYVTAPYTGQYDLYAQCSFAANGTGKRYLKLQIDTGGGFADFAPTGDGFAAATPVAGDRQSVIIATVIALNAGDKIRMRGFQNCGSPLACTNRMSLLFVGPA